MDTVKREGNRFTIPKAGQWEMTGTAWHVERSHREPWSTPVAGGKPSKGTKKDKRLKRNKKKVGK